MEPEGGERMSRKYELLGRERNGMRLIRALRDIPRIGVTAGDIGGYVEDEKNLSQEGDCWVYGDALVHGNAQVHGNAWVCGDARVYGYARVYGDARLGVGAEVQQEQDVLVVGLGNPYTTFCRTKTGISVVCGCFSGTLEDFREKVRDEDTKYAREYELACQLAELHILGQEANA